eukprot:Lankesteria_metandrocarpae@DN3960_c1_g1_i1.p1
MQMSMSEVSFDWPVRFESSVNPTHILYEGLKDWELWSLENFDSGAGGWNPPSLSECGTSTDMFLGGHCKFGDTIASRSFSSLPQAKFARITARVHFFDAWEGETLLLKVNNVIVWSQEYDWCPELLSQQCMQLGVDTCGRQHPDK